jgi:glycosyltransferase 2 family protein
LRCAGAGVALSVLVFTFRHVDFARVHGLLDRVSGWGLAALLVPMGASLLSESLGWAWAFRSFGRPVPLFGLFRVRVTSEALALTLPAGVLFCESIKPFLLARHCGLPTETSIAGMGVRKYLLLLSQAVYLTLFGVLGGASLEIASVGLLGMPGLAYAVPGAGLLLGLTALGCALTLHRGRVAERVLGMLARLPWPKLRRALAASRARFTETDSELRLFFRGSLFATSLPALAFLASWLLEALETYLILRLLGVELPFVTVAGLEVVLSLVRHVTFLLPAGLGVQDLGYVAFLRVLGVADPLVLGAAFVLLKRAKECAWALLGLTLLSFDLRAPGRPLATRAVRAAWRVA